MKYSSIKTYLRPQSIYGRRSTTISHAFAAAIVPIEAYDAEKVKGQLVGLGQDNLNDLTCVYCDKAAETWDHLYNLVRDKMPNGGGHQVGNLVPCCGHCNSEKGSKDWRKYLQGKMSGERYESRCTQIEVYCSGVVTVDLERMQVEHPDDYQKFWELRDKILLLMHDADEIASRLHCPAQELL